MGGQQGGAEESHQDRGGREEADLGSLHDSDRPSDSKDLREGVPIGFTQMREDFITSQFPAAPDVYRQRQEHAPENYRAGPTAAGQSQGRKSQLSIHENVIGADVENHGGH